MRSRYMIDGRFLVVLSAVVWPSEVKSSKVLKPIGLG